MPRNWNQDQSAYVLRYKKDSRKLLVKAIPLDNQLLVTFLLTPSERTAELSVGADKVFSSDYRTYDKYVFCA